MYWKTLSSLVLIVFLSGCSTMMSTSRRDPSTVSQLRIKMAKMEKKLSASEEEVVGLKNEILTLENRVKQLESYDIAAATTPYETDIDYNNASNAPSDLSAYYQEEADLSEKDKEIIRVEASIHDVQKALKNAGYYNGAIDGKFGARSKSAVFAFQKDHDLSSDGIVGQRTWTELRNYLR